jgi:hypothetical protein
MLWFLLACAEVPPAERCPEAGPPQATIGEGATSFDPIEEGEEPLLERGPQGGVHLMLAAQVEAEDLEAAPLALRSMATAWSETCPEGCVLADATFTLDPDLAIEQGEWGWTFAHLQLIVNAWPLEAERWLDFELTDACGRGSSAQLHLPPSI